MYDGHNLHGDSPRWLRSLQLTLGHAMLTAAKSATGQSIDQILELLKKDSDVLYNQVKAFTNISTHIRIVCFYEELATVSLCLVSSVSIVA